MMIIETDRITKRFGAETVLRDVSISLEARQIHGFIGQNGSGKTMLLRIICGLYRPTSGIVKVRGKIVGKDMEFPDSMGILIESPGFIPYYSAMKNLKILSGIKGKLPRSALESAMEKVGLDPALRKSVGKYSLGMRQRLGIAQAIMEEPEIIILDEPMNGLDKSGMKEMRQLVMRLKDEGRTILLASHNLQDIEELCDTVFEMDAGVIARVR